MAPSRPHRQSQRAEPLGVQEVYLQSSGIFFLSDKRASLSRQQKELEKLKRQLLTPSRGPTTHIPICEVTCSSSPTLKMAVLQMTPWVHPPLGYSLRLCVQPESRALQHTHRLVLGTCLVLLQQNLKERRHFQRGVWRAVLGGTGEDAADGSKDSAASEGRDSEQQQPWQGALFFRRGKGRHLELATTLERLHLAKLSSQLSRDLALQMGLKDVSMSIDRSDGGNGGGEGGSGPTPVLVSVDVEQDGADIRLEGTLRTAITVRCNRCLALVAERVLADVSLKLTERPVEEPAERSLGVVLSKDSSWAPSDTDEPADGVLDIDLDDRLHFPATAQEVDISTYIRDSVHLEMPIRKLCREACRGLCIVCGVNLNKAPCRCKVGPASTIGPQPTNRQWGLLEQLKAQMQDEEKRRQSGS
eukprot:SM000039S14482  [mRNA]  locus=s39:449768:452073:+ [translate_table: standard]